MRLGFGAVAYGLAGFMTMIPEDWARQCNMGAARGLSMSDR